MDTTRVKFYGMGDLAAGMYLPQAAEIVKTFNPRRSRYGINDIIELYNVLQYVQAGAHMTTWSTTEKDAFLNSKGDLYRVIKVYFDSITGANFSDKVKSLNPLYIGDFLDLFMKHKLPVKVTERQLKNAIKTLHISVHSLVKNELMVKRYPTLIKSLLLSDSQNAEIIINKYLAKSDATRSEVYLPSSMSEQEKIQLIDDYIGSADVNVNYIRLVGSAKSEELNIPDELRLKAIRAENSETDKIFADNPGFEVAYQVGISKDQVEEVVCEQDEHELRVSFSEKWLKGHLDFPTILNNFIYLFEYAHYSDMLITLVSTESSLGVFESVMGVKAKADYPIGMQFQSKDYLSFMEITAYREFLSRNDIRLEDVIVWFFMTYVKEEFQIDGLKVTMPSKESSYREKCNYIFPEMESMLKQFKFYVTKGAIDQELVRLSTVQTTYSQLPTLNKKRYLYPKKGNTDIQTMLRLMFSDQSGITYINDTIQADTFYELVRSHDLKYKDFHQYQTSSIDWLKDMGILQVVKGRVTIKNRARLALLAHLNRIEAISYHHLAEPLQKEANVMLRKGLLEDEDNLFTRPEVAYFNYHLNKKEFGNSLDLKNKYSHGTPPVAEDDNAEIYKQHYLVGLRLIILLIIKINDDLCIRADMSTSSTAK